MFIEKGGKYYFDPQNDVIYDNHAYTIYEGRKAYLQITSNDMDKYIYKSRKLIGLYVGK